MNLKNLTWQVFGRLKVIERAADNKYKHPQWLCLCECGNVRTVSACNLVTGNTRSCGCLKREVIQNRQCLRKFEAMYNQLVLRATHPVLMSYEEFFEFTKIQICHYCEAPIDWSRKAYNLDRKNNKKGYTSKNCVVCCKRCNYGKSQFFTYDEWVKIGKLIRSWKK